MVIFPTSIMFMTLKKDIANWIIKEAFFYWDHERWKWQDQDTVHGRQSQISNRLLGYPDLVLHLLPDLFPLRSWIWQMSDHLLCENCFIYHYTVDCGFSCQESLTDRYPDICHQSVLALRGHGRYQRFKGSHCQFGKWSRRWMIIISARCLKESFDMTDMIYRLGKDWCHQKPRQAFWIIQKI